MLPDVALLGSQNLLVTSLIRMEAGTFLDYGFRKTLYVDQDKLSRSSGTLEPRPALYLFGTPVNGLGGGS